MQKVINFFMTIAFFIKMLFKNLDDSFYTNLLLLYRETICCRESKFRVGHSTNHAGYSVRFVTRGTDTLIRIVDYAHDVHNTCFHINKGKNTVLEVERLFNEILKGDETLEQAYLIWQATYGHLYPRRFPEIEYEWYSK